MDAYNASIFYGLAVSPTPVANVAIYFLFLIFSSHSVYNIMPSFTILDDGLPTHQFFPGSYLWCVTTFLGSTILSMLPLYYLLFSVSRIATGNDTGSSYDFFSLYLALLGTIISILKFSPRSPLTKVLLLFIIEYLIVCRNCQ